MRFVRTCVVAGLAGLIGYRIHQLGWRNVELGLIDHPLEVFVPSAARWLTERPDGAVVEAMRQLNDLLDIEVLDK